MLNQADIAKTQKSVFFGSLPEPVFDAIIAEGAVTHLKAGETLFRQGDPAASMFAVLDGLVKLSTDSHDGNEVIVEVFHSGTSFAEALAFRHDPYPVSASALMPSRVVGFPNELVQSVLRANPDAFGTILSATSIHLHSLVRQIEQLKSSSGLQRVARYLLELSDTENGSSEVQIPYEKQILASLLGIKPETLSRAFRRLHDHGVAVDGQTVRILSRSRLEHFLDGV